MCISQLQCISKTVAPISDELRYSDEHYSVGVAQPQLTVQLVRAQVRKSADKSSSAQTEGPREAVSWSGGFEREVDYLSFPNIEAPHAVSTRVGGLSLGDYEGLNIGQSTKDAPSHVHRNRLLLEAATGVPVLSCLNMVHGTRVVRLDTSPKSTRLGDACITDVPGLPLMITTADCVPIVFYDPVHKAVGLAHGGWRGTLERIALETIKALSENYGTNPADLQVGIGPSIGPCCFSVQEDVSIPFEKHFPGKELILKCGNSVMVDLWRANYYALLEGGAVPGNICISRVCTSCQRQLFFSYRRDRGITGRMASVIALPG